MPEQLIYEEGKVRITTNVFSNGQGEQFVVPAIKGIRDLHKGKSIWVLLLGLAMMGLASLQPYFPYQREALGGLGLLFTLWYFTQKERHKILLLTAAGEVEAFSTKNEQQHKNVYTCLKKAMSMHGAL